MRSEKRRIFSALFFSGLLFLLLDSFLIFAEYEHYQQKYQMASLLLGNSQTDLQILKNEGLPSMKEAEGVLSQYGDMNPSVLHSSERNLSIIVSGSSLALRFVSSELRWFYFMSAADREKILSLSWKKFRPCWRILEVEISGRISSGNIWKMTHPASKIFICRWNLLAVISSS